MIISSFAPVLFFLDPPIPHPRASGRHRRFEVIGRALVQFLLFLFCEYRLFPLCAM